MKIPKLRSNSDRSNVLSSAVRNLPRVWPFGRMLFQFLAVTSCVALPLSASAATRLVLPLDSDERPSPVCTQCTAGTELVTSDTETNSAVGIVVWFTFEDDAGTPYDGDVRITIRSSDGEYQAIYDDHMNIGVGETVELEFTNEEITWSEVEQVFFELATPRG